jgi:pyridoxine kinase
MTQLVKRQKRAAIIQDMSGFGRCSLTVALPLLSAEGIQSCPVPTAMLSNHTGYPSFYFYDFTGQMTAYTDEWRKMKLDFDGIYAGFLGSKKQIGIVEAFIRDFKREGTLVILDPVMGDHGETYATYTGEMCREMKKLVAWADILTPNLTEACLLTGRPYRKSGWKQAELQETAEELVSLGAKKVVITGIEQGGFVSNFYYEEGGSRGFVRRRKVAVSRPGTGDVFASLVAADTINGVPFPQAVGRAADFVKRCLIESEKRQIPVQDGVCFEVFMRLKR